MRFKLTMLLRLQKSTLAKCSSPGQPITRNPDSSQYSGKGKLIKSGDLFEGTFEENKFVGPEWAKSLSSEDGKVVQSNFHDYDAIRMHQAPDIEVRVLENGKHIRELPLRKHVNFI